MGTGVDEVETPMQEEFPAGCSSQLSITFALLKQLIHAADLALSAFKKSNRTEIIWVEF